MLWTDARVQLSGEDTSIQTVEVLSALMLIVQDRPQARRLVSLSHEARKHLLASRDMLETAEAIILHEIGTELVLFDACIGSRTAEDPVLPRS